MVDDHSEGVQHRASWLAWLNPIHVVVGGAEVGAGLVVIDDRSQELVGVDRIRYRRHPAPARTEAGDQRFRRR